MKFLFTKSVSHLILTGFSAVALPLIAALVIAALSVDRLLSQSQHALVQSVLVTQGSQVLVEAITAMERNARQYQVLGDAILLDVYKENHAKFAETVNSLSALELSSDQRSLLEDLRISEGEIYNVLDAHPHDAEEITDVLPVFTDLATVAKQILAENRELINRGIAQMQERAGRVQQTLFLQAIALVPAALFITIMFTVLITRPIRQIDHAIRRLGDGKFDEAAVVTGPGDLEQLGERLDWLRNRLIELEQEKTKFLQHISHELKTPLTAIREGAELMNEQVVGDLNGQQREIVGILRENSIQLQKLIEDLLNFSVLRSRASGIVRHRVDLKAIIKGVLEGHRVAMLSRKLDLRVFLQPVKLNGDEEKLRIMADNLISNAIKYSPDGGPVWVLLSRRNGKAVIDVADAGPGIPESARERVFEAFFQGPPASKGHVRGSGLGLSIAREYAQAHSGDITVVESGRAGARLQVILPLEKGY